MRMSGYASQEQSDPSHRLTFGRINAAIGRTFSIREVRKFRHFPEPFRGLATTAYQQPRHCGTTKKPGRPSQPPRSVVQRDAARAIHQVAELYTRRADFLTTTAQQTAVEVPVELFIVGYVIVGEKCY